MTEREGEPSQDFGEKRTLRRHKIKQNVLTIGRTALALGAMLYAIDYVLEKEKDYLDKRAEQYKLLHENLENAVEQDGFDSRSRVYFPSPLLSVGRRPFADLVVTPNCTIKAVIQEHTKTGADITSYRLYGHESIITFSNRGDLVENRIADITCASSVAE